MKTKQTIKRMVLTVAAVTAMVSLAAPATMAQEVVRDHRDDSEEAIPIVRDHRDGSEEEGPIIRDHRDDSSSTVEEEEEEPYKDPGIRQCDITPPYCEDTEEEEEPYKDPGIRQCDITPPYCEDTEEQEHEGEANASATAQAGQTADSGTIYGCAYDDYYYDEETDMCWPNGVPFGVLFGEEPWPESAGGYVGLLGDFVEDPLTGLGLGLQAGLGYVGDALVEFGETGNFVGWPFQGLGYAIGFLGDVGGALGVGVGEAVGAVADGVGEAIDAVGDAAEDAWDEVTSWF